MRMIFLLIYLILKILLIKITVEEPVIDHDILKTHAFNNTPKYWFEFVKKFLYNTIKKDKYQIGTKFLAKQLNN